MKTLLYLYLLIGISSHHTVAHAENITDRLMVRFSSDIENQLSKDHPAKVAEYISRKTNIALKYSHRSSYAHILQLKHAIRIDQALKITQQLTQLEEVDHAEPDRKKYPSFTPNDQFYFQQWNLHPGQGSINIENSWSQLAHDSPVIIAVIDTGITSHTDFNNRIIAGYDFISDLKTANDGDGRDRDPADPGDAVKANECGEGDPEENTSSSWHGTIVTGLLAAETNNHIGISGIVGLNPQASVMPIRVLGKCGGYTSDIIDAARWASGLQVPNMPENPNPAQILNLSLGGKGRCTAYEQQAINDIIANNTKIVVSAGNENEDAYEYSPSGCNGVITVAASSRRDGRADYSNYGYAIDISAPGGSLDPDKLSEHLFSTYNLGKTAPENGDAYAYVSGSSFAAPAVTGAIALLLDINPGLSLEEIYGTLRATSRNFANSMLENCSTDLCGSGILDIDQAVYQTLQNNIHSETLPVKKPYDTSVMLSSTTMQNNHSNNAENNKGGGTLAWLICILVLPLSVRTACSSRG